MDCARQEMYGYFDFLISNVQNHCTGLPCFGVMVIVALWLPFSMVLPLGHLLPRG